MWIDRIGLAVATVAAGACCSLPAAAGDLYRGPGSMKDVPVMMSSASPCYIRGDLGYSWSTDPTANFTQTDGGGLFLTESVTGTSLDNTWLVGAGIGCGSGSRGIRGEIMFDYRGSRDLSGTLDAPDSGQFATSVKGYTLMFNGYYDLGKFDRFVPYVGAGVGFAHNEMGDVNFTNSAFTNTILGDERWSLAWSLMAGFGLQLSERAVLDFGYRYIDMGKVQSSRIDDLGFANPPIRVDDLAAHEFKIGLRYHFGGGAPMMMK